MKKMDLKPENMNSIQSSISKLMYDIITMKKEISDFSIYS